MFNFRKISNRKNRNIISNSYKHEKNSTKYSNKKKQKQNYFFHY